MDRRKRNFLVGAISLSCSAILFIILLFILLIG